MSATIKDRSTLTPLQQAFLAARDVSVPIICVRTPDPGACVAAIAAICVRPTGGEAPVVQWDCVRGFAAVNATGQAAVKAICGNVKPGDVLNPVDALVRVGMTAPAGAPEHTTVIMLNLHDFWGGEGGAPVRQALWNLRDVFKPNWRTLVATQPVGGVPVSMEHDVLTIDEPLPSPAELDGIVRATFESARLSVPTDDTVPRAVAAVAGLSAFAAEQAVSLSLRRRGLDFVALRERHRQMIENTKGLSVWRGTETFAEVGGLNAAKRFMERFHAAGEYNFGSVFWIDELEKALAGVKGDLTGITQDYLATLLGYMQDNDIPGILLMGHPGTGKSYLAKAFSALASVPTIRADLGAMHGSLVGESQHALRHAIKVQHAVSQGRPLFVATCNNVAVLPPELTNRFVWRFFVDLPTREEKDAIWPIQMRRRGLDEKQTRPADTEWNGREIDQCCRTAKQLKCSLVQAAEYIIPIAQSSAEEIERRRREASGRYLSASEPGAYEYDAKQVVQVGKRQINLPDEPIPVVPGSSARN